MAQRRLLYLTALLGCLVFYWAYRAWLSGILLTAVLLLPVLSLLLSLPMMLLCRVRFRCPEHLTRGQNAHAEFTARCPLPCGLIGGKLRLRMPLHSKRTRVPVGSLPTGHCGALLIRKPRPWVSDYLGLWSIPLRATPDRRVLVRPTPVHLPAPPDLSRYLSHALRPKPGGGYSENHEFRLYRPGDNLRQIHWKLTAKTGKLILREPLESRQDAALLTLELRGTPEQLDRKLGQLLWLSQYLIGMDIPHRIACLTGSGLQLLSVGTQTDILPAVDTLLCSLPAPADRKAEYPRALWRFHIGGDSHE